MGSIEAAAPLIVRSGRHSVLMPFVPLPAAEAAWSPAALSVWGKLDCDSGSWMPLVRHLDDTGAVASWLWDDYLPAATRAFIAGSLDSGSESEARALVGWLASIHDIGKISPPFAAKATFVAPSRLDVMRDHGLDARPGPEDSLAPHGTVGQHVVNEWLKARWPGAEKKVCSTYTSVIGGHHGTTPTQEALVELAWRPRLVGTGQWDVVRAEVLDAFAKSSGADRYLGEWVSRPLPLPAQVLLTGLVIMADWIASNTDYFPLIMDAVAADRLEQALDLLDLPQPWLPYVPQGGVEAQFASRFPALSNMSPRPLQTALVAVAREVTEPGLFIVEGPMGVGKTEAALLAAEVLAGRFGQGGVFVGLPTMATANPMFVRVRDWLGTALNGGDVSISLAHGKAALNDAYTGLLRQPWTGEVYDEGSERGGSSAAVVVNNWLRGRKRSGLADFVVGTIDQSLFAALKAKHVVLRHLGLAGKVVIIDEVHAADEYMRKYLGVLLEWLGSYRAPVILMSATLPPDRRDEFLNAYAKGSGYSGAPLVTDRGDEYPRISVAAGGGHSDIPIPPGSSPSVQVGLRRVPDDLEELVTQLGVVLAEGGCVGVICNTVTRAQEAYEALRGAFDDDVLLTHSRFIAPDRARREAELVQALGPGADPRPQRLIVVGTQVLEQSLDVDFDLLVTDLAPIDLVLQRAGRLHRHQRSSRPRLLAQPEVWLRGVKDWSATPPMVVSGSKAVYGTNRPLRAAAVLEGAEGLSFPEEIPGLVRRAYDLQLPAPAGWEEAWLDSDRRQREEELRAVGRAQTYLMPGPHKQPTLNGLIDISAANPEVSEERGASQVRDSEDGLEVMVLCRDDDGALRLPECAPHLPGHVIPQAAEWVTHEEMAIARDMAACTLRLPMSLTHERIIDTVISELENAVDHSAWQRSPWVAGQLALVLDSAGRCQLAGHQFTYDSRRGLQSVSDEELHQ